MKQGKMSRQRENRNIRLKAMMEFEEQSLVLAIKESEKRFREGLGSGSFDGTGSEMEEWTVKAAYYRRRLKIVRECIQRMEVGEFGICACCSEDISDKRLKAVPTAIYCLACQQDFERDLKGIVATT